MINIVPKTVETRWTKPPFFLRSIWQISSLYESPRWQRLSSQWQGFSRPQQEQVYRWLWQENSRVVHIKLMENLTTKAWLHDRHHVNNIKRRTYRRCHSTFPSRNKSFVHLKTECLSTKASIKMESISSSSSDIDTVYRTKERSFLLLLPGNPLKKTSHTCV